MQKVRVFSCGLGVQSSSLLKMAEDGLIEPFDFAVFADPMAEGSDVYEWKEKITPLLKKTRLIIASAGDIATDTIEHWKGNKSRVAQPPFYAKKTVRNKYEIGMIARHCTVEYKIDVVTQVLRKELGFKKNQKINPKKFQIEMIIGISYEEKERMRISQDKWRANSYPLVDMKWRRSDCQAYVETWGIGQAPRSACYFCPYKSNKEWQHMKTNMPQDWEKAVEFDSQIRRSVNEGLTSEFYVHRDCVPLDKADLTSGDENQISMLDECHGMCGN